MFTIYIDNQRSYSWENQLLFPCLKNLHILSDFDLTEEDASIILSSLNALGNFQLFFPVPNGENRVSLLVLSETGSVVLHPNDNATSESIELFFIHWGKVQALSRSNPGELSALKISIILEEMCHSLYMISDEWEVKELVHQILLPLYPNISLHDLFPKAFDRSERRIQD